MESNRSLENQTVPQQDNSIAQKILSFCKKELIWCALGMNIMIIISAIVLGSADMLLIAFMNVALLVGAMQINAWSKRKEEAEDE